MSSPFAPLKVLIADDNAHLRTIVAAILDGLGIRSIQQYSDGAQALDGLRRNGADVAFVDFQMQPIDGVEFTQLVRTSPDSPAPQLPIIMMTAYADRANVMLARDSGVNELIVKPLTAQAVVQRLTAVVYKPRPFVRGDGYLGPCRRRRQDPAYKGPLRRAGDKAAEANDAWL